MFRFTLLCTYTFWLLARAIVALCHCFNNLYHLFQNRFFLKENDLARGILKGFFRYIQTFIDEEQKMITICSTDLLYLPSQSVRFPQSNQLYYNTHVSILA